MLNTILASVFLLASSNIILDERPAYPSCVSVESSLDLIDDSMEAFRRSYHEKGCQGKDEECVAELSAFFGLKELKDRLEKYHRVYCREL